MTWLKLKYANLKSPRGAHALLAADYQRMLIQYNNEQREQSPHSAWWMELSRVKLLFLKFIERSGTTIRAHCNFRCVSSRKTGSMFTLFCRRSQNSIASNYLIACYLDGSVTTFTKHSLMSKQWRLVKGMPEMIVMISWTHIHEWR